MAARSKSPAKSPRRGMNVVDTDFQYPASYAETEPFSKPHTVTVLLGTVGLLMYALYAQEPAPGTDVTHIKRGLLAALAVGLVFCAEHLRDTLFIRPHPAIWRFVNGLGLFYTMALAFALFQPVDNLRDMMKALDPEHAKGRGGDALPEFSYAEDCSFSLGVIWAASDRFVVAHFVGWIFKAFMFRHVGIAMATSFLFELCEYTFEFLQPNFAECWWDHWLLDFVLCNTGGIVAGHLIMDYLGAQEYSWVGISKVPSLTGKLERLAKQFTPHHWTTYEWGIFSDFKRFAYVTAVVVGTMVIELDAFFLKYILRVQPASALNVYRLVLWWAVGMVGLRDYYAFMTNPRIKRLGATMWTVLAMTILEAMVVIRFGSEEWASKRPPFAVWASWTAVFVLASIGLVWWFGFELPRRRAAGLPTNIGAVVRPDRLVGRVEAQVLDKVVSPARSVAKSVASRVAAAEDATAAAAASAVSSAASSVKSIKSAAKSAASSARSRAGSVGRASAASPASTAPVGRGASPARVSREAARLAIAGTPTLGGVNARQ